MSPAQHLVEGSYYDHADHGTVKLVSVDATTVSFQVVNRHHYFPGGHRILAGKYEAVSDFKEAVEPADVVVSADLAVLNSESTNQ